MAYLHWLRQRSLPSKAMRPIFLAATFTTYVLTLGLALGQPTLQAPSATVGKMLETAVVVTLNEPAPDTGLEVTLRSGDPKRMRISNIPDQAGGASVIVHVRPKRRETPEFWIQALDESGTVSYTADAPGFSSGTGTVSLTPAAILLVGPGKAAQFSTTTGAVPSKIRLFSARLDSSLQYAEEQAIAGGSSVQVSVSSSNLSIGAIEPAKVAIPGGTSFAATQFQPAAEGGTTLSVSIPAGFRAPAQFATITALVRMPGLGVSDELVIGQNLQVGGVLSLGEVAPAGGVTVTLTSDDPSQMLISTSLTEIGSRSVSLFIPAGGTFERYYLQVLGKSGTVKYTASARGYRSRVGMVKLAPSGVIITPAYQGPPDEAQVLYKSPGDGTYRFTTDLKSRAHTSLVGWTVQLDPVTHRSADITVQPLRAGVSLAVSLTNSNPSVGTVGAAITIPGGTDHASTEFTPLTVGSTNITVTTPKDFTPSANSTTVVAIVRD